MKTVPLVVYEWDGRTIIGQAIVDVIDDYIVITATIDLEYIPPTLEDQLQNVSLGSISIEKPKTEE